MNAPITNPGIIARASFDVILAPEDAEEGAGDDTENEVSASGRT